MYTKHRYANRGLLYINLNKYIKNFGGTKISHGNKVCTNTVRVKYLKIYLSLKFSLVVATVIKTTFGE